MVLIPPHDMRDDEIKLLITTAPFDYSGRSPAELVAQIISGRLQLWRISGLMRGLMLTRLDKNSRGKTLWIEGIGGDGLVEHRDDVHSAIKQIARRAGCSTFSGLIQREGMDWLLASRAIPIVAHIFQGEVEPLQ